MGKMKVESYAKQRESHAAFLEKKGAKLWAAAKNNPDQGYKYNEARKCYEKVKDFRKRANEARKKGMY